MKVPIRLETNFSRSNTGVLGPHEYFLKDAFYFFFLHDSCDIQDY